VAAFQKLSSAKNLPLKNTALIKEAKAVYYLVGKVY